MTAINDQIYRQTKIIATLGPSTSSRESIEGLIDAGVDAVRLNFSHGDKNSHIERAKLVRKIAEEKHYHVAIIGDLQGPKIRITKFLNSKIGQEFSGVISGVTEWGLYVELDKNKCEGLVKINQISKNYLVFDKKTHSLTSTSKEIKYQLGQKVLVKILKADIEKKQVDFSLIN